MPLSHHKSRRQPILLVLVLGFLLWAATCYSATTKEYVAQASDIPQIDSIAVGGTWVADEQIDITIGYATLSMITGSGTTTQAQVASVIVAAVNASIIDAGLIDDETRYAAGQLLGPFRDVKAYVDPSDDTKVLIISVTPGVPFGTPGGNPMTVSTDSASGTVVRSSVQAADGRKWWSNGDNWSDGSVPGNDDTAVLRGTDVGPCFGIPDGSLEVTVQQWDTFTGTMGLPLLNTENGVTYTEYRQRYVRLDDSGTGTEIKHRFGLGDGPGSPLINIVHTGVKISPVIFSTAAVSSGHAINIIGTEGTSTIDVLKGSVDCGAQDGQTPGWATIRVGQDGLAESDCDVFVGDASGSTSLVIAGGSVLSHGVAGLTMFGGKLRAENTSGAGAMMLYGGKLEWAGEGTITSVTVDGGFFEAGVAQAGFVVTDATFKVGSYHDPYKRTTFTNDIDQQATASAFQFNYGSAYNLNVTP